MKSLSEVLRLGRRIRAIGFDDSPFAREAGSPVKVAGVVCVETRFEGMLWGTASKDGDDATAAIAGMLLGSKFHEQVHAVLTDGVAIGGFNVIDLPDLAQRLDRPVIAVMRRQPDLAAVRAALARFDDAARRLGLLEKAGEIYALGGFVFQCVGVEPAVAAAALGRLTDKGQVPEPLRLAHLIGAAIAGGQSGRRA